MPTSPRHIVKAFSIKPGFMVEREDRDRWLGAIVDLCQFDMAEIMAEREAVARERGPDKPRYFYLEAVRRRLILKRHEERKRAPVAESIRQILKAMAL